MTFAIKEKGKQTYVAKEQFGIANSLMLAREGGDPHYHPREFPTRSEAKVYLIEKVLKTRTGRRRTWEIVEYI